MSFPFFSKVDLIFQLVVNECRTACLDQGNNTCFPQADASSVTNKKRRPAEQSAGLLKGDLFHICLVATVTMAAVKGELPVRLGVASLEALAVVIADKVPIREGAESAMRDRVRPPLGQSVIEAPPLLDQLPASVYATVAVTIDPSPTLR